MNVEDLQLHWQKFCATRLVCEKNHPTYISERNVLLEHYYPLVTKVAENMSKKIKEVDIDDLVDWGTDGLFHAVHRFDPTLKIKFETFAIHRIRGSILDNIRQVDWVPRLVRQRYNQIQKAKQSLETDLGRSPTDEEMATRMNLTLEDYLEIKGKSNPVGCISMYASSGSGDNEGEEIQIESFQSVDRSANNVIIRDEMFKKLLGRNFIPLERKIMHMHYYDNMTMKEIADKTGYSESRISQMHAKVIERLQKKIKLNPEYMSGLESLLQS